jgi:hypothetical protein
MLSRVPNIYQTNKINKGVAIIMTHDKETLINILKLNASFLADAKKLDEVTCALDIVQSLAWQLEEILQQEKSAPAAATTEAVKNNTPCILYDNPDDMPSEFHVGKIVHTPDGDGKVVDYKDGFVLTWLLNKRGWHSYAESDLTPF